MQQDSTLNNLVHAPSYRTSTLGTIPEVVKRGNGPVDVLLIPGWGFGARDFEQFMRTNTSRYRMVAVTLPGFAGSAAPPMPPAGTSYGDATWTRAAEEAIVRVIEREGLRKAVVIGHFIVGTQVAFRLALDHPELVGGLVIVGGEADHHTPTRGDSTGTTPVARRERVASVDRFWGPQWFKTVTKAAFDTKNYRPLQYSRDSVRAMELWKKSSDAPLPVMIRYLCEYMASDMTDEFARVRVPTRVLVPSFTPEMLADPTQRWLKTLFVDPWESVRGQNSLITTRVVPDSRIFITEDRPDAVRDAITEIAAIRR